MILGSADSSDEEYFSVRKWKLELAWLKKALEIALQLHWWGSANRSVYSTSCSSDGAYCVNQSWRYGSLVICVSMSNFRTLEQESKNRLFNQLMPFFQVKLSTYAILF